MKSSIRKAFLGEAKMAEDLVFTSSDDALQHLANLTGKSIKISGINRDKGKNFYVKMNDINNDAFVNDQSGEIARILKELAKRIENGDISGRLKDMNGNTIGSFGFESYN